MTNVHQLTNQAAEAIRATNHATVVPGSLGVDQTCLVVAELCVLARGLDRLYHQLDRNLHARVDHGRLRHDGFVDSIDNVVADAVALRRAARHVDDTTRALTTAMNPLSHVADSGELS